MNRAALAMWAFAAAGAWAQVPDAGPAMGARIAGSRDTDGFEMERAGLAGYVRYVREGDATGVLVEHGRYAQGDWHAPLDAVTVIHHDTDRRTAEGLRLATSLSHQGGRTLAGGDLDWSRNLDAATRLGVVADRDWVETARALQAGLHADLLGASIDRALGPHLTVVGFAAVQRFSDGNVREHLRARLITPLVEDLGLTAQLHYRAFATRTDEVEGRYFSPRRYAQWLGVLALRRRFERGWSVRAEAGIGRQQVGHDPSAPSWLASLSLARVIAGGATLRFQGLATRAASFDGPDYRYRSVVLEGEVPF